MIEDAQVAYEAYCAAVDQSDKIKAAWRAAAEAVLKGR